MAKKQNKKSLKTASKKKKSKKNRPASKKKFSKKISTKKKATKSTGRNLSRILENKIKGIVQKQKPDKVKDSKENKTESLININIKESEGNKLLIFDTNFLLIPAEFKVDIFQKSKDLINTKKLDMAVFDKTIYELQKIKDSRSKSSSSAKIGLQLINVKNITIIASKDKTYVDDMFLNYEKYLPDSDREVIVATQDKELKKRLKQRGIKVIYMAARKKLAIL